MLHVEKMENDESILHLMHAKTCRISIELNTEVPLDGAEVLGLEGAVKMILELGDEPEVASDYKYVVDID